MNYPPVFSIKCSMCRERQGATTNWKEHKAGCICMKCRQAVEAARMADVPEKSLFEAVNDGDKAHVEVLRQRVEEGKIIRLM